MSSVESNKKLDQEFKYWSSRASLLRDKDIGMLCFHREECYRKMALIGKIQDNLKVYLNYTIYESLMKIIRSFALFPFVIEAKREIVLYYNKEHLCYQTIGIHEMIIELYGSNLKLVYWLNNFIKKYVLDFLVLPRYHKYYQIENFDKAQMEEVVLSGVINDNLKFFDTLKPYETVSSITALLGFELSNLTTND